MTFLFCYLNFFFFPKHNRTEVSQGDALKYEPEAQISFTSHNFLVIAHPHICRRVRGQAT